MKVVFLDDVPGVARSGEIKEVANGYARNYLIPKNMALIANSTTIKMAEARSRARAKQQAETDAMLEEQADMIDGKEITIKARAGSQERLYGSITSSDIAAELEKSYGVAVDKRKIELEENIHQLGSYEISLKLGSNTTPKIKVNVVEEQAEEGKGEKPEKKITEKKEEKLQTDEQANGKLEEGIIKKEETEGKEQE
jgi:large subunit ribosomal protein L9